MSTLTTRDIALRSQPDVKPAVTNMPTAPGEVTRSVMSRLFTWYRHAVLSPATEQEKENWQKDSF